MEHLQHRQPGHELDDGGGRQAAVAAGADDIGVDLSGARRRGASQQQRRGQTRIGARLVRVDTVGRGQRADVGGERLVGDHLGEHETASDLRVKPDHGAPAR